MSLLLFFFFFNQNTFLELKSTALSCLKSVALSALRTSYSLKLCTRFVSGE